MYSLERHMSNTGGSLLSPLFPTWLLLPLGLIAGFVLSQGENRGRGEREKGQSTRSGVGGERCKNMMMDSGEDSGKKTNIYFVRGMGM